MSNDTLKLTDQKVLEHARESLREHLPLQAQGYTCTSDDGLRLTLAIQFVLPSQDTRSVLDELLKQVKNLGIGVARLFLDKGFARISVLDHLTHCAQPALIACPIRGKRGATRPLCQGNQSYRTIHTFKGARQSTFTAQLAVCRVFTSAKRTKGLKRRGEGMSFILIHLDLKPQQTRRLYRKRFGIESSYRLSGQVRGWTTSNNPAYRFVLIAVSFLLLNVWVHLRWLFTQVPRRGGRWLDTKCFQLARLAKFIIRALERHYGCVQEIVVLASPRP